MRRPRPLHLALVVLVALALAPASASAAAGLPPVKHVFYVLLENENADSTFGPATKAPYLARTLPTQGQFMPNFFAVTHLSLGNYVALVSGQGSTIATQADCNVYQDVAPGTVGADGQAMGQGCVYPKTVKTIADQLTDKGLSWKGYMEDMGNTPGQPSTCRHPALNAQDTTQSAKPSDQYAARHNPFVYFHTIIDKPSCAENDVPLDRLPGDLHSEATTANYVFITPNLCHDGHDEPCVNGEPGGMVSADRFLQRWVPAILASPAYRAGGLLVITFDEAEAQGSHADSSACCDQPQFPNTPNNGGPTPGRGGGRIGAVLLSPYVKEGTVNRNAYSLFSLLRSTEDIFDLGHLGYAAQAGLRAFGSDVFDPGSVALTDLRVRPGTFRSAKSGPSITRKRRPLGASVSYKVSQPGLVTFRVQRRLAGRLRAGRCVKLRKGRRGRRGRRCVRFVTARGAFDDQAAAGENSFRFTGRLPGRRLRPGRYRLVARADGWGGSSKPVLRRFRIVRR
jgi:phosphatidylinositol-3-phosphatase